MTETHRHFHDELSQVKVRLLTMSGEAEAALGLAVEALLERDAARAAKDFVTSDLIRERLQAMGLEVMDSAEGTEIRPRI